MLFISQFSFFLDHANGKTGYPTATKGSIRKVKGLILKITLIYRRRTSIMAARLERS